LPWKKGGIFRRARIEWKVDIRSCMKIDAKRFYRGLQKVSGKILYGRRSTLTLRQDEDLFFIHFHPAGEQPEMPCIRASPARATFRR